jgi:hypothetical protein
MDAVLHDTSGPDIQNQTHGDLSRLLGIHINHGMIARTISMDQSKYLKDMVKHSMSNCKPSSLPIELCVLSDLAHMDSPLLTGVAKDVYPSMLGSLRYARMYP